MTNSFNPFVSIVIPVYNGENYLHEAIDSALAQTYSNLEIIVVNDGSSDATEEVALSYGNKIRYFSKANGGTSTALNIGVRNMKGEYFSWLSHDDMYYPTKIEAQVEELGKLENKHTIIISDLDGINAEYEKIYVTDYASFISEHPSRLKSPIYPIVYMRLHGCGLLIPRVCFDEVGVFDESSLVAQDFEFFYRVFKKFPYKYISQVLVTARDTSNRQGIRSKSKCSVEYSNLLMTIFDTLSEDHIKLLAPDALTFYKDMKVMCEYAGYEEGLKYILEKTMPNVQINYSDTVGGKFNGYEMHLKMRERGIDSHQLVYKRDSNDQSTAYFSDPLFQAVMYPIIERVENLHNIRSLFSPFNYDIITNHWFLNAKIVHYHILHHPAFNLNMLPLMTRLKPSVWSLHDPWALTGHCVHPYDCTNYETGCGDCPDVNSPFGILVDNSALTFSIKKDIVQRANISIIVASDWMKQKVEKSPITKGKPIYVVPFGLDLNIFQKKDKVNAKTTLGIEADSFSIMFRSTKDVFKSNDLIKDVLRSLDLPRKTTVITVDDRGLIQEFSDKYNIREYGWVTDNNLLADLYNAADIFLMPSKAESFGLMAAEAMCCGTMVLGTLQTALPYVINAPYCGIATECNSTAYGKELQRLLNNPQEIRDRGIRSYEFAVENYNIEKYIDRILDIYREVIKNHHTVEEDEFLLQQIKRYNTHQPINTRYENLVEIESKSREMMNHIFTSPLSDIFTATAPLSNGLLRYIKRKTPQPLKTVVKKIIYAGK